MTNRQLVAATVSTLAIGCGVANAQTPPPENKDPGWEGAVNAGLTLTSGNSDTVLATLGANAKKKWDKNEFALGVLGGYGEAEDVKNAEFAQAFAQYNRMLTERFYAGGRIDGSYDGIANLSYRINLSPLVGYYFIKNAKTTLSGEVGPSYVMEKYFGEDMDSYLGIRFAEKFEHKLTDSTKIWQYADYTPDVERWTEKYVINVEVGISTAINKTWSLRVVGQYIYDSLPAPGREKDDMRLIAGTEYKF